MSNLLLDVLRNPGCSFGFTGAQWDLLVRQARHAELLARVGHLLQELGLWNRVPEQAKHHFASALTVSAAQHAEVRREVRHVHRTLQQVGIPVILLKGAAYVMANLPSAKGRTFSDIDILVRREHLAQAEKALFIAGWAGHHHDPYDQRYYREWMHELPPLQHLRRGTHLDVHHAIMPETARIRPSPAELLAHAVALDDQASLKVLAPADMILHSMTHLLHNEEMNRGLRDLSDLDLLLRHHGGHSGFWEHLQARAISLQLERPLHYALRMAHTLLGTPVPDTALVAARRHGAPPRVADRILLWLWMRGLNCHHHTAVLPGTPMALALLFVRAHWLRMPLPLLLRHITEKVRRGIFVKHSSRPI